MSRFFTPLLLLAGAGYVHWYNTNHDGSVLLLPFIDIFFPRDAEDPEAMGRATVQALGALGAVTFVVATVGLIRDRFKKTPPNA